VRDRAVERPLFFEHSLNSYSRYLSIVNRKATEPVSVSQSYLVAWLLAAIGCAFVALITRLNEVTHDVFHEMALAREFWQSGVFHTTDVFAFSPTISPVVHHEWGTGFVFYAVSEGTGWGLAGLTVLKFALIGVLGWGLFRVASMRGAHPYVFCILSLAVFPLIWVGFVTLRATMFTLVCLTLQLWMQEWDRRGYRWWIIPWWCLFVAWLNLHAGFVVGLGIMGLHVCDSALTAWLQTHSWRAVLQRTWHLALLGPLVVLALPINPYGWDYVPYLIRAISMPRPLIAEWRPLWHTYQPLLTLTEFGITVLLILRVVPQQKLVDLSGLMGLVVSGLLALKHLRHGCIYAVIWVAYVPAWVSRTKLGQEWIELIDRHRLLALRLAQIVVLLSVGWAVRYEVWQAKLTADPEQEKYCYPVGVVDYLKRHAFSGNLLTPFHTGAYVTWVLYPEVKVSLDGRYEVAYAPGVFEDHWNFFDGKLEWVDFLEKYPNDAVLVQQTDALRPKLEVLRDQASDADASAAEGWHFVYEDDAYAILARRSSSLPYEDHRVKLAH